jgi:hypothetical protein
MRSDSKFRFCDLVYLIKPFDLQLMRIKRGYGNM